MSIAQTQDAQRYIKEVCGVTETHLYMTQENSITFSLGAESYQQSLIALTHTFNIPTLHDYAGFYTWHLNSQQTIKLHTENDGQNSTYYISLINHEVEPHLTSLEQLKLKYPTSESFYDMFLDEGKDAWEMAWDIENDDPTDKAIEGTDIVLDAMEDWITENVRDDEYDEATVWFESMSAELNDMVFNGLS